MDINVLKELNLELLTERQRTAVSMALDGKTQTEIGRITGCSPQNISCLIKSAIERNLRIPASMEINSRSPSTGGCDYRAYNDRDLSTLSPREKEILTLKIAGLTYRQISERLGTHINYVCATLRVAREKLDGSYYSGLRLTINRRVYEHRQKHPDKAMESRKKSYLKYREKRIEDIKEYNKNYYRKHREEILKKQKEKRLTRLEEL